MTPSFKTPLNQIHYFIMLYLLCFIVAVLNILKGADKESIRSDRERERMRDRERRDRRRDSPDRRRALSPIRRRDISPIRRRDMSPIRRRDISPIRKRDISPIRRRDLISPDRSHDYGNRHRSPRLSPFNRRDCRSPPRERRRPRSREIDRDVRRFDNYNTSYEMRRTNHRYIFPLFFFINILSNHFHFIPQTTMPYIT